MEIIHLIIYFVNMFALINVMFFNNAVGSRRNRCTTCESPLVAHWEAKVCLILNSQLY